MKKTKWFFPLLAIVVVAAIAAVVASLSGKESPQDLPEIQAAGILRVVTDYNSTGYYVSGDTMAGFNCELLKVVERYSGLKVEVEVENDLMKSIEGLNSGKYDLIARNLPVNVDMKEQVAFTQPIIRNKLVLVQRKAASGSPLKLIRSHLDMAHVTVYVPKASPAILRLENLAREIGDTIFIREDSLYEASQLIMKVAAGEIDYTVSDANTARILSKKLRDIDARTDIGFTHLEAWAVRQSSPILLDSLNVWLNRFQDTKQFLRLYNRYYK
ncbi:MAG: transporter substrate-binding domain-containing protein [Prevotella sp.]|jgi:membrane-bound lytic murein transglycosylase MltF|nr:transporter substrate-binding domain-containing protein [Prevotella sp.]